MFTFQSTPNKVPRFRSPASSLRAFSSSFTNYYEGLCMALDLQEFGNGQRLSEGPAALARGSGLFLDIQNETHCKVSARGAVSVVAHLPGGPNGVAIGPDGAAYVCNTAAPTVSCRSAPRRSPCRAARVRIMTAARSSVWTSRRAPSRFVTGYGACDGTNLLASDDIVFDSPATFGSRRRACRTAIPCAWGGATLPPPMGQ